ncbi:hypothetical protein [Rahnella selenatireducens]|uniref:hypothetical protein n=1 Tax=Rahnella selenatireducens TaxID=3389797 RepID=UPI00396877C8
MVGKEIKVNLNAFKAMFSDCFMNAPFHLNAVYYLIQKPRRVFFSQEGKSANAQSLRLCRENPSRKAEDCSDIVDKLGKPYPLLQFRLEYIPINAVCFD